MTSRRLPRWIGPDGEMPDAQTIAAPRSLSATRVSSLSAILWIQFVLPSVASSVSGVSGTCAASESGAVAVMTTPTLSKWKRDHAPIVDKGSERPGAQGAEWLADLCGRAGTSRDLYGVECEVELSPLSCGERALRRDVGGSRRSDRGRRSRGMAPKV